MFLWDVDVHDTKRQKMNTSEANRKSVPIPRSVWIAWVSFFGAVNIILAVQRRPGMFAGQWNPNKNARPKSSTAMIWSFVNTEMFLFRVPQWCMVVSCSVILSVKISPSTAVFVPLDHTFRVLGEWVAPFAKGARIRQLNFAPFFSNVGTKILFERLMFSLLCLKWSNPACSRNMEWLANTATVCHDKRKEQLLFCSKATRFNLLETSQIYLFYLH